MIKKLFAKKTPEKRGLLARPLRLGLFALMFLAVLMVGARIRDIVIQIAHGETPTVLTAAKAAEDAKPDEKKTDAAKPDAAKPEEKKPDEKKPDEKKPDEAKPADAKPADAKKADDKKPDEKRTDDKKPDDKKDDKAAAAAAKDLAPAPEVEDPSLVEGPDLSESEINVLKHLSDRRKELDKKSSELDQRETLLNVTEQRVDKKITDLKQMQEDIRKVLGEQDAGHKAQVASMVKIYETMKPKDAARIFEGMDTPTLVEVMSRMKEARSAPVLASMNPMKAKEVTTALMAKKALPATP